MSTRYLSRIVSLRPNLQSMMAAVLMTSLCAAACGDDSGPVLETSQVYAFPFGPGDLSAADLVEVSDGGAGESDQMAETGEDEPDLPPGTVMDGEACELDHECVSRHCLTPEEGFPEGLCSPYPCGPAVPCEGSDPLCYQPPSGEAFCGRRCTGSSECRSGYHCEFFSDLGFGACVPAPPAFDMPDGEPCHEDGQCGGGQCLLPPEWPGGYCTTMNCEDFEDCTADVQNNQCLVASTGGVNFCVRMCETTSDCRSRYVCHPLGEGQGYCAPDPNRPIEVDPDSSPLPFDCSADSISFSTKRISYTIDESTTSYMVVPVALDGRRLQPDQILVPGGGDDIDFFAAGNNRQAAAAQLLGFASPMVFPYLPNLVDQLHSGNHDFDIATSSAALCHYVLEESTPGTTIDINFYLVGVPGVRADIAAGDINLIDVMSNFDEIYEAAGISLGEVRFIDAEESIVERYGILRSEADLLALASTSLPPGETLDEQLSANVFLLQDIQMGGPIGISTGLPGPAGLHQTIGSGVVVSTSSLGVGADGNSLIAMILAHELGHYLGLWHTTELYGRGFDALDDTPECETDELHLCPDYNNLMFPTAGSAHTELSEGQMFMIQMNPLTKD